MKLGNTKKSAENKENKNEITFKVVSESKDYVVYNF